MDEALSPQTRPPIAPPAAAPRRSAAALLAQLGLAEKCAALAEEAGIDDAADFAMFTEAELVSEHGFKAGHARKILAAAKDE